VLGISRIHKNYGSKVLFDGADAHLGYRSRAALIGPNGAGKSTLIRMILGQEAPDQGTLSRASHLSIGHLAQEPPKTEGRTVLEETLRIGGRREELLAAKGELEALFARDVSGGSQDPEELEHYGRVLEELEALDEYRLEARAKAILGGMGFQEKDFHRPLTEFSGGWLMRVALARVLLSEPDLLLLDEPTNHLDLESLLWLEEFLRGYRGALLLVSHDTEFLNRMVTEVIEIDQRKLFSYRGNLDAYAAQKAERLEVMRAQRANQDARIADLERFISRFGAKATKARQAQSRRKELERIEEDRIDLPEDRSTVRFRFPPAPHSGREVVTLKKAGFGYPGKPVFKDLDFILQRGRRIAIVGVNGVGKTTLLKLLAGELAATSGVLQFGHAVMPGYYAQHQSEALVPSRTVLQELESEAPDMPVAQVRAIAGAFLFSGDAVEKRCGVLSGGEKARVALAKLLLSPSNFLILDEPTNHLDVESRGVLLEALQDYEGTLLLVSHDRAFVGPLVDQVLEIVPAPGGSEVRPQLGTYDDYVQRKVSETRDRARLSRLEEPTAPKSPISAPVETKAAKGPSNNQRIAWQREREKLEKEIAALEGRQAELSRQLSDPTVYEDKVRALALMNEQREVEAGLEKKMSRWEELCGLLGDA
jgi:ATP-binding cassette subfamily F protein 3